MTGIHCPLVWTDREGTSSLTSLELDTESGAPWECARWASDSYSEREDHFFYFFPFLPQTLKKPRGPLCLHLVSSFQLKMQNEAQVQAVIVWSFQVKKQK